MTFAVYTHLDFEPRSFIPLGSRGKRKRWSLEASSTRRNACRLLLFRCDRRRARDFIESWLDLKSYSEESLLRVRWLVFGLNFNDTQSAKSFPFRFLPNPHYPSQSNMSSTVRASFWDSTLSVLTSSIFVFASSLPPVKLVNSHGTSFPKSSSKRTLRPLPSYARFPSTSSRLRRPTSTNPSRSKPSTFF